MISMIFYLDTQRLFSHSYNYESGQDDLIYCVCTLRGFPFWPKCTINFQRLLNNDNEFKRNDIQFHRFQSSLKNDQLTRLKLHHL